MELVGKLMFKGWLKEIKVVKEGRSFWYDRLNIRGEYFL